MPSVSEVKAAFLERLFSQNERVIKLGLNAMNEALSQGLQPSWPLVLVGGTNGKGQVSAYLANFLQNSTLRTGLFTSPHLVDYGERIRVDAKNIEEEALLRIGLEMLSRFGHGEIPPVCLKFLDEKGLDFQKSQTALSFFELSLAIAQKYFLEKSVDFGIYEVGLGGRLDATNALEPCLSIITSISRDHVQWLGSSIEEIAFEKAGIMRSGKTLIIGRTAAEFLIKEAQERHCKRVLALGRDFHTQVQGQSLLIMFNDSVHVIEGAGALAQFQQDNLSLAAVAALVLVEEEHIQCEHPDLAQMFRRTQWPGRMWEVPKSISQRFGCRRIILDAAHNEAALSALSDALRSSLGDAPCAFVVNACGDKDIEAMAGVYLELVNKEAVFVSPVPHNERILSPKDYCLRSQIPETQICAKIEEAIQRAAKYVGFDGTVIVTGSIYLLGAVISQLEISPPLLSIRKC